MIYLVHQFPYVDEDLAAALPSDYPNFGMPEAEGRVWELRSVWLQDVMYILMDTDKHLYFGQHAYALVKDWFAHLMWDASSPAYLLPGCEGDERKGAFAHAELNKPLLDPMPYFVMFSKWPSAVAHSVLCMCE